MACEAEKQNLKCCFILIDLNGHTWLLDSTVLGVMLLPRRGRNVVSLSLPPRKSRKSFPLLLGVVDRVREFWGGLLPFPRMLWDPVQIACGRTCSIVPGTQQALNKCSSNRHVDKLHVWLPAQHLYKWTFIVEREEWAFPQSAIPEGGSRHLC